MRKSILACIALHFLAYGICCAAPESELTSGSGECKVEIIAAPQAEKSKALAEALTAIINQHRGRIGVSVKNLNTSEQLSINGDELFPTASTIKLAVMCAAFAELSKPDGKLQGYYTTHPYDDATSVGGSGFIKQFKHGTKVEVKELLHLMITVSDNVATNMLLEWIGGLDSVNAWLKDHGFVQTRIHSYVFGKVVADEEGRKKWGLGVTSPNEMCKMLEMIYSGKAGTTTSTDEMLRILGHQYFDGGIAAEVPPFVWVGSKSGAGNETRSDNAIVAAPSGPYIISVYTKQNADRRWTWENEGERAIQKISRLVWRHFNPEHRWTRPDGTERL